MATKELRVGMIGYGFMGRAHSNAYKQVGQFFPSNHRVVLKAACARDAAKAKAFADQWGYESTETDWRKLVERKDIDAIDVCTPNNSHAEIAIGSASICAHFKYTVPAAQLVAVARASMRPSTSLDPISG